MSTTVRAPDGRTWRVTRRWVSHRVRWKGRRPKRDDVDWLDVPDFLDFGDELGCLGVIAIAAAVALLILGAVLFVFPAVIFLVELVILVVLIGGGIVARVLFRRPWTVEAVEVATSKAAEQRGRHSWQIVGWRRSGEAIAQIARHLEAGVEPAPGGAGPAPTGSA